MKAITAAQKEFLFQFFASRKLPDWKNIADSLLYKGTCIVAGEECIWKGGIGDFIKTETATDLIGCSKYTFDVEYFMTSAWYKENEMLHKGQIQKRLAELEKSYKEEKDNLTEILNW